MNSLFAALDAGDKLKVAQLVHSFRESNANINVAGAPGNSLMFKALEAQDYNLIELLLDSGIDPNLSKLSGAKLLHLMVKEAPIPYIAKVIEKGADTNCTEQSAFTPLHLAARTNRSEVVELLLNKGASPNSQNDYGWTPLHCATHLGNIAAIRILLKNGARTIMADKKGWTPLHVAVDKQYKSTLELLCTIQIDKEMVETLSSSKMISPLHLAAKTGNVEAIQVLLAALPVDIVDKNGWTPLMLAVLEKKEEAVECLLRAGADPNKANTAGVAPIHIAIKTQHTNMLRLVVDGRADVNVQDKHGYTALHLACKESLIDMVKILLDRGARTDIVTENKHTALHIAVHHDTDVGLQIAQLLLNNSTSETIKMAATGDWTALRIALHEANKKMMKALVDSGCSLDFHYGKNGTTPLCWAAKQENLEDITDLIESGKAAVNLAQISNGWSPLHFAADKGNAAICRYLLAHSADANQQDKFYRSPLDVAYVSNTQSEVESVFLEFGAKPHIKNSEKAGTAAAYESIHQAIVMRDLEAVKQILQEDKGKIHARDAWGNTPLHTAIQAKRQAIFCELATHEPDFDAKGENDQTPLHFACLYHPLNAWFVTQLFKFGSPNPNAVDKKGKVPLHYAAKCTKAKNLLVEKGADASLTGEKKEEKEEENKEEKKEDKKIDKRAPRRGRGGRERRGREERGRGDRDRRDRDMEDRYGRDDRESRGSRDERRRRDDRGSRDDGEYSRGERRGYGRERGDRPWAREGAAGGGAWEAPVETTESDWSGGADWAAAAAEPSGW